MNKKGFTFIELVLAVAIITALTTIAYLSYSQYSTQAENIKKQSDLDAVQSSLELEKLKSTGFPSKIQ